MKKPAFVNEQFYHIFNRGVEKRTVFENDKDRVRFIHDLFEFNDTDPAINVLYRFNKQSMEVQPQYIERERKPRKLLLDILAFCLMPNHYHLLVKQRLDNGVINFMKKIGTGYTMYFNQKYQRVGPLFQGRFKAALVNKESHLLHLPFYIHANPLDIILSDWQEEKFDLKRVGRFLNSYRWSSYLDYSGQKNFPSITQREFFNNYFKGNFKKEMDSWMENIHSENKLENIKDVTLE